jgi:hypothetical protein
MIICKILPGKIGGSQNLSLSGKHNEVLVAKRRNLKEEEYENVQSV